MKRQKMCDIKTIFYARSVFSNIDVVPKALLRSETAKQTVSFEKKKRLSLDEENDRDVICEKCENYRRKISRKAVQNCCID